MIYVNKHDIDIFINNTWKKCMARLYTGTLQNYKAT